MGVVTELRVISDADTTERDLASWSSAAGSSEFVSLYLPTHRAGKEVAQDPVRLRRLLASAAAEVAEPDLLAAANRLVGDSDFWLHGTDGLAVLAGVDGTTAVRLSEPPRELVVVSDRCHLKPLVAAAGRRIAFDVLALSRHRARFVTVTGPRAVEVDVPGMPAGMAEALRFDDRERQVQSHASTRVGAGRVAAKFHGQGGAGDDGDADLARYLRQVDQAVARHRAGAKRPLVLAGVDEIVGVYRKLAGCECGCGVVVDGHVAGNADQLRADVLADRARALVQSPSAEAEELAREAFRAGATAKVDTIEQAVIAAAAGKVATVFVPEDREYWGRYREGSHRIEGRETRAPGDHDLADVAAVETLRHGGQVFVVPAIDIPRGGTAAASLRY